MTCALTAAIQNGKHPYRRVHHGEFESLQSGDPTVALGLVFLEASHSDRLFARSEERGCERERWEPEKDRDSQDQSWNSLVCCGTYVGLTHAGYEFKNALQRGIEIAIFQAPGFLL